MQSSTLENEMSEREPRKRGRPSSREKEGRQRRVPLGAPELKLSVPQAEDDKDHVYRFINDTTGRLQRAVAGGWEYVEDSMFVGSGSESGDSDADSRISRVVGKQANGEPLIAYLMKIKREWYEEDQDKKQSAIDEVENTIKHGHFNEKAEDARYIPKEGIKL